MATILTRADKGSSLTIADNDTNLTNLNTALGQGVPQTTKGDIGVHSGTTNVRLPVGTTGQKLYADSAQAAGIGWASGSETQYVTNVAALRALATAPITLHYSTLGYTTAGDGGRADYRWDSASTDADDSLLTIKITAVATGRFKLIDQANPLVTDYATLRALSPLNGRRVRTSYKTTTGDGGAHIWRGVTGASAATYVHDNVNVIVPSGGDGSTAWLREREGDSFRNPFANGACLAALTASSVALTTSPVIRTVDGWLVSQNSAAAGTSIQAATSSSEFPKAIKLQRNAASASTNSILTINAITSEDSRKFAGRRVTLSVYFQAGANFSGANVNVALLTGTGTNEEPALIGTWAGVATPIGTSQVITTTLTRYEFRGVIGSTVNQIGVRFYYDPVGTAGADDSLTITGLQLEAGNDATDYEHRPFILESIIARSYPITCGRLSSLITNTGPIPGSDPFDSCHFIPYNGNQILINGRRYYIPDGALAASGGLIARYASCYRNKVAGQSLADNTFYFIYVFALNDVPTLNFSTTGYSQNGVDWGNAVKSDDPTCTLVGICYINHVARLASPFDLIPTTYGGARGQTICSYFNQFRTGGLLTAVAGSVTANSATQLPDGSTLNNGQPADNWLEWVQFYDSTPVVEAVANAGNTVSGNRVHLGIGINSRTTISGFTAASRVGSILSNDVNLKAIASTTDATGYYFAQAIGYETEDVGAGTASFDGRLLARHVMV